MEKTYPDVIDAEEEKEEKLADMVWTFAEDVSEKLLKTQALQNTDKMMNDILAQALSKINNAAVRGKSEVTLYPSSKVVTKIMTLFKEEGYIQDFKSENTTRGTITTVQLNGKINKVGSIKPRFSVTMDTYEKFEKRYLPAKDF